MDTPGRVVLIETPTGVEMEYKGIRGTLTIDAHEEVLCGRLLHTGSDVLVCYEGNTVKEIKKMFKKCVNAYLISMEKEFSI